MAGSFFSGLSKNCHLYSWIAFSDPTSPPSFAKPALHPKGLASRRAPASAYASAFCSSGGELLMSDSDSIAMNRIESLSDMATIQVEKLPFIENPDGADYSDVPCKKQIAE